ncbi:TrbG/VirB9 family P-type conjugative transfer protein [Phenylobacterium sp.]|uniref:TrbG/VirB9 family P-type conjugative transfer protein n=1 Tax=Phenylobacterium sp. TaxID=1871053 RepID=UPI0025FDBA82|nr:TrbG/VirB9 family P-type conjugative transfer protein [Phenylobacterium sp.]MBX3483722.1 TrbG/VirB9 family P-type conjugative transfer protein [Phenylobacterium sp.]MCW5758138.1 TrbG/VirB9 family P-type conjugative transfer protein [Phenylobacterium sp.]
MMRTTTAIAFTLALAATPALAVTPRPGPGDPRIHVVDYDPAEVVELRTALGFQLALEFDPLEKIENVAIGDSLGWQVTPNRRANLLFLKPMSARPPTNMTVITNARRYNFQLSVQKQPSRNLPFTVRFLYAPPVVALIEAPPPPPPPVEANSAYSYDGSSRTLPVKVFDDGRDTYFTFRGQEDLPAIFAVDPDGGEAVVNTRQRDGYIVVDRIARGFVLRRGAEVTRIYNDGFRVEEASLLRQRKKDPWWRR